MSRLPVDVAHEIAVLLQKAGVTYPHIHTVDYAVKIHRIELLRDTISWMHFMAGTVA